jgi:hypothetical protein
MGDQPLLAVERAVERVPGRGPCQALAAEGGGRKARLYKGHASPAMIATGGPTGCGSRPSARASLLPCATPPIRNSIEPVFYCFA